MHPIEACVRNPVKVAVGAMMLALFGFIALFRMPMQLIPEVQTPTITIETRWPGASPQEVEREITQEQEEQLKSVEGVTKMTSESMDSMGRITMEFYVGTNMEEALLKVNSRLQQVPEYPEDADEPVISTSSASDRPIAWFILGARRPDDEVLNAFAAKRPDLAADVRKIATTENAGLAMLRLRKLAEAHPEAAELLPQQTDVTKLRRYCEDVIEARFERVSGVSNSNVMGGLEEELQVVVDPQKLAARQLTLGELRTRLRLQNKDTSAGDYWEGKRRYVVRTLSQFNSSEEVESQVIAVRDGVPVFVRDVAEVRLGYKKPDGMVRRFGTSSIAINALRETGANVLDVMDGLREATRELNEEVLVDMGLELTQVYDETEYIHSSIDLVTDNIYEGGVLTFIVLLLFLRNVRSSVVIFISIGVSIVGMFLIMKLMGRSLNVPSLAGIAFAVGMLVDNFIVVLENIYRHRQQGDTTLAATIKGTEEVWGAIVAATLANLAVFIPVLFVQDEAGQLFRDIAIATSAAVALSLLVALIVVPTAASRILAIGDRRDEEGETPSSKGLARIHDNVVGFFKRAFGPLVGFILKVFLGPIDLFGAAFVSTVVGINRWLLSSVFLRMICITVLVGFSVIASWLMMPKVEYLPSGNRNLVFGILLPPPGYNLDELQKMGREIEQNLRPYWDVDPNDPEVKAKNIPVIADFFFVARGRSLFIGARAHDPLRARELIPLIAGAGSSIPGTFCIAKQTSLFETGLTGGRTIEIEITGPEITQLVSIGGQILGQVGQVVKGAQARPIPSLDLSSPEMHIIPKWDQAADMGVNAADLGYTVDALVDGA
ncbi:MAG: efflux RND transporter permease subunit, partial [Planctomycetales bacterium]|nr:efflux RND transporter permease subunit [Planctomycetales bacterium]